MGPAKPWADLKRGEVSISRETPPWGELSWDRRGASFSLGREDGNQRAGQSENCTQVLTPALPTQPEKVSSTADKGWVLEPGVWRADPGRGLWLAVRRHPEGTGGREELCKWDACGGSLNHQRSRAALLSDALRAEPPCSLSAPVPVLASPGNRNGSQLGG